MFSELKPDIQFVALQPEMFAFLVCVAIAAIVSLLVLYAIIGVFIKLPQICSNVDEWAKERKIDKKYKKIFKYRR